MGRQTDDELNKVSLANSLDVDYRGKTKDVKCLTCKNGCQSFEFIINGNCENYKERITLNEINREIRIQNINIRKLCKDNNLKYYIMVDMLKNKIVLSYKYYIALENRIFEKEEYLKYY
jgi:hypothetical protein